MGNSGGTPVEVIELRNHRELSSLYKSSVFDSQTFRRAGIVICWDDGDAASYSTVFDLLKQRGLIGNFAPHSDGIDTASHVTTAQLKEMHDAGYEILNHSKTHTDPTAAADPWANFQTELSDAQTALEAKNLWVDSFKQPGTWTGDYYFDTEAKLDTRQGLLFKKLFAAAALYWNPGRFMSELRPAPSTHRWGPGASIIQDESTLVALQAAVDRAITFGGLLVMGGHPRNLDTASHLSVADYTTFLDYVKAKRDAGYIDDLTFTGATYAAKAESKINLLRDPFFEDSVAAGDFVPAWLKSSGTPTLIAGGGSIGSAAKVSNANILGQAFLAHNLRTLCIEGKVKSFSGAASTARVKCQWYDGASTDYINKNTDIAVSGGNWTSYRIYTRGDPRAAAFILKFYAANSGDPDVLFSDLVLYKV